MKMQREEAAERKKEMLRSGTPLRSSRGNDRKETEISTQRRALICAVVGLVLYATTVDCDFLYDDVPAVKENPVVIRVDQSLATMGEIFSRRDFWGGELQQAQSHKSYRPITSVTYRWQVQWFAKANGDIDWQRAGLWLHGGNAVIFSVTAALFFLCTLEMFGAFISKDTVFLAGLLFATHPLHTEAVASLVGRCELLSAMFFFLSIIAYRRSSQHTQNTTLVALFWHAMSVILCFFAMLSKEQGITCGGIWVCLDALAVVSSIFFTPRNIVWKRVITRFLVRQSITACALLSIILWRFSMNGRMTTNSGRFSAAENPAAKQEQFLVRLLTFTYVAVVDLWLLFVPYTLSCDWSMGSIPLVTSLRDGRVIAIILVPILFILLWLKLFPSRRERFALLLAACLTCVPFLPSSNMFFYVGFVVAERVLFLPSAGACVVMAMVLKKMPAQFPLFVLLAFSVRTVLRNREWTSLLSLMEADAGTNPGNGRVLHGLGNAYLDLGRTEEAKEMFKKAIEAWPEYNEPMNTLGVLAQKEDRFDNAVQWYNAALNVTPAFSRPLMNLADLYRQRAISQTSCSEEYLQKAEEMYTELTRLPSMADYAGVYSLRAGEMQLLRGSFVNAAGSFLRADAAENGRAFQHLGSMHAAAGRLKKAKELYSRGAAVGGTTSAEFLQRLKVEEPDAFIEWAKEKLCHTVCPSVRKVLAMDGPGAALSRDSMADNVNKLLVVFENQDRA
eukprot:g863.t1